MLEFSYGYWFVFSSKKVSAQKLTGLLELKL